MTATQGLEMLLSFVLQVCVLVLATSFIERKLVKSADRCAMWSVCFLGILFLAATGLLLPRCHLIQPWQSLNPRTLIAIGNIQVSVVTFLLKVWALGVAGSLLMWLAYALRLHAALRRCELMPPGHVREWFGESIASFTSDQIPRVLISNDAPGPYCVQLHHPIVVIPRTVLDGSRDDLQHVLFHELAHLKSHHPVQLFFQRLVQVVCWFHPIVWRASANASLAREFVCDDAVIDSGIHCAAYLRTLLHIAERSNKCSLPNPIGFGRMPAEIVLRAKRLVELAKMSRQSCGRRSFVTKPLSMFMILVLSALLTVVIVPSDPMASSRAAWSSWPSWTAQCLYAFGIRLRDFERFDRRVRAFEQLHDNGNDDTLRLTHLRAPERFR